ncbi:hypothetical protein JCM5296_001577 [Sporobolomyces johnsonii]
MQHYWGRLRDSVAPFVPPALASTFQIAASLTAPPEPDVQPFPDLPSELILRILAFTLPPPDYSSSRARTALLCDYALLSRDCARRFTLEHRRDVHLPTTSSALVFYSKARAMGPSWAGAVRTLRLGDADDRQVGDGSGDRMWRSRDSSKVLRDLLRVCTEVEELWICGMSGLELEHLAAGQQLRRLYLTETRIVPSSAPDPPSLQLPSLTSLHLKATIFTGPTLSTLLLPSTVPSLATLDYLSVHQSLVGLPVGSNNSLANILGGLSVNLQAARNASGADSPILPLAPQLKHLSLGPHSTRTLAPASLPLFSSLITLSLPVKLLLGPDIDASSLSQTLRAIRLTDEEMNRSRTVETPEETARSRYEEVNNALIKALEVFQHGISSLASSTASASGIASHADRTLPTPTMHRFSLAMLSFLALFIALPRVFGKFSNDTPECIINCYNIQFAKAAAGDYAPLETGQLLSLCNSNPWMADLSTMWSNECVR